MTFLNPIGWIFLGLVPVLVALYLRRVRRRLAPVSTLLFWQRARGEKMHRAWFGRLRQWLSLLLQLLILLLLILALVRPEPGGREAGKVVPAAESTVLVIDGRARMQAREPDGETRFAKALKLARKTVAAARENFSVAVLVARPAPEVVSPFSTDAAVLAGRLGTLMATDAGGSLEPALALAKELAATRPGRSRVLLLTDRPAGNGHEMSDIVETVSVGSPLDNVAITRFAARREVASPETADLLLEVANFGHKPVRGNVEIVCDGTLLDVKPFELGAGERKAEVFPTIPTKGGEGRLTARLDRSDALPLDDTAYALLPTQEPCRVLLVTRSNWFLEKLLAADTTVHFDLLSPDNFQPEMAGNFDAVIFDDCCNACGLKDLDAMAGNALFIKSSPLPGTGILEQPPVSDSDPDSPLLRFVQWRNVTLFHATQLLPPQHDGWTFEMPLRSVDHPLIVAGRHRSAARGEAGQAEQKLAVFAFDIADSDLPLRVAFPLLISNTLHWLAGQDLEIAGAIGCGQSVDLGQGESVNAEPESGVAAPSNRKTAPPLHAAGSFQPVHNGFYRVDSGSGPGASHRWLAVNTFSDAEADLTGAGGTLASDPSSRRLEMLSAVATGSLWRWLTLAALALLALEWWLFHRGRTE